MYLSKEELRQLQKCEICSSKNRLKHFTGTSRKYSELKKNKKKFTPLHAGFCSEKCLQEYLRRVTLIKNGLNF